MAFAARKGCCAGADCQPNNKDHDEGEPDVLAHHAQRVVHILEENFPVLTKGGDDEAARGVPPEAHLRRATGGLSVAVLIAKHGFHFAREVIAKVARKQPQQGPEEPL